MYSSGNQGIMVDIFYLTIHILPSSASIQPNLIFAVPSCEYEQVSEEQMELLKGSAGAKECRKGGMRCERKCTSSAGAEECEEVLVDVCEDVPEDVCETVIEKHCRTVQEQVCDDPEPGQKQKM